MSTPNSSALRDSANQPNAAKPHRVARAKVKATAIHLLVSALLFLPFLYLLWFIWYPMPYFVTDGGWQGVRIMLAVDMVIGPFLTALVYHPDKTRRALTVDYTFISLVQAAALAWGTYNVESQKPLVVSLYAGAFTALVEERFEAQGGADYGMFESLSLQRPPVVFAPTPDEDELKKLIDEGVKNGLGAHELQRRFLRLDEHLDELPKYSIDMAYATEGDPYMHGQWQDVLRRQTNKDLYFLRLDGRFRKALVAVDQQGVLQDWIFPPAKPAANSTVAPPAATP